MASVTRQYTQAAADYLSQVAVRCTPVDVPVQIDVRHDLPAEAILAAAGAGRVDLIVMSTRGQGGFGRWLLGSVAAQVLRAAPTPVLLVRAQPAAEATPVAPGQWEQVRPTVPPLAPRTWPYLTPQGVTPGQAMAGIQRAPTA